MPDPYYSLPHPRKPGAPWGSGNVITQFDSPEWRLGEPELRQAAQPSEFLISVPIARESRYYTVNVIAMSAAVTLVALITFLMPVESLNDRANFLLTILLTQVAFIP